MRFLLPGTLPLGLLALDELSSSLVSQLRRYCPSDGFSHPLSLSEVPFLQTPRALWVPRGWLSTRDIHLFLSCIRPEAE